MKLRRLLLGLLLVLVGAAPASAGIAIRNVDLSSSPSIRLTVVGSRSTDRPPRVFENGTPVVGLQAVNLGRQKNIVLAVDHSQSMHGRPLRDAARAAETFIALGRPGDRFAVVTFASEAVVAAALAPAGSGASATLDGLRVDPNYGTVLYDAVVRASTLLASGGTGGRVIVLVTDGQETTSHATLKQAIRAARNAHVSVYPVAIETATLSPASLKLLARRTGGTYHGVRSSRALSGVYAAIAAELRRTWQLQYLTAARPGDRIRLRVSQGRGMGQRTATLPGHAEAAHPRTRFVLVGALVLMAAIVATILVPAARSALWDLRRRTSDPDV